MVVQLSSVSAFWVLLGRVEEKPGCDRLPDQSRVTVARLYREPVPLEQVDDLLLDVHRSLQTSQLDVVVVAPAL
jgi:hypothetical protein